MMKARFWYYLKRKGTDVAIRRVTGDIRFMEPSVFLRTKKHKCICRSRLRIKGFAICQAPTYRESYGNRRRKFKHIDELNKNGCIVDLKVDKNLIDQANEDIDSAIRENSIKLNSRNYHYNENQE